MNPKRNHHILSRLPSILARVLTLCLIGGILFVCIPNVCAQESAASLGETADCGEAYLDRLVFFGESTTAHLRARGVLRGGRETTQVWSDPSGTKMLSSRLLSEPILYPESGELVTVAEACTQKTPDILVLSFGLNGVMRFHTDIDHYLHCYGKLIETIQKSSPATKIILQTVYPVCKADAYSVGVDTLNAYLSRLNDALPLLTGIYQDVRIVDTASVLRDRDGRLRAEYAEEDGIHLNRAAYEAILHYLRTHAWK